jgi:serine protease Do
MGRLESLTYEEPMASFDPQAYGFEEPPPRPTTPPVRRGFLVVLLVLCLATLVVYGVPYVAERTGYAWEAGRARAASRALAQLEKEGIVSRASDLFRLATVAVSPAVVNVQSLRERRRGEAVPGLPLGGNLMSPGFRPTELGSGVVVDKDRGYIVTNNHVVKDADRILVRLARGEDVPARLVGADMKSDLAVLQVRAPLKVQAEWGDSDKLDIGDWVLAIGSPYGFDHSVTAGIVSATDRNGLRFAEYESFIQTDAAINQGNSGGPLVNLAGKVVGINTAIISQTGAYEGIGLAIPATLARRVVESLIKQGKVVRGYLGVIVQSFDTIMARQFGLPSNRGALVVGIQSGSPAARVGLKVGDVIVKVADREVANMAGLKNLTASLDVGALVPLTFYRQGKPQTVNVTIDELAPAPEILASMGFRLHEHSVPDGGGTFLEIDQVIAGSPAHTAGLRPGHRILAVGDEPVNTLAEFEVAVRKLGPNRGLQLVVQSRDGKLAPLRLENDKKNNRS